ncbi:MAG: metallophosphoesterase family protein [Erysipelotrichaceae bacterium]
MKIIVLSDNHGKTDILYKLMEEHQDAVSFIHCGDIECEPELFPNLTIVSGNNDLFYDYPEYQIIQLGGKQIFIVHGHQFLYHDRLKRMALKAIELECDIVCYGHTHVAAHDIINGIHLINPGSLWRSRDGRAPSYAILTINEDDINVEHIFLETKSNKFY